MVVGQECHQLPVSIQTQIVKDLAAAFVVFADYRSNSRPNSLERVIFAPPAHVTLHVCVNCFHQALR